MKLTRLAAIGAALAVALFAVWWLVAPGNGSTESGGSLAYDNTTGMLLGWLVAIAMFVLPLFLVGYVVWLLKRTADDVHATRTDVHAIRQDLSRKDELLSR